MISYDFYIPMTPPQLFSEDLESLAVHQRPLLRGVALGGLHRGAGPGGRRHLPTADALDVAPPRGLRDLLPPRLSNVDLICGALALEDYGPGAFRRPLDCQTNIDVLSDADTRNAGVCGVLEALLPVEHCASRWLLRSLEPTFGQVFAILAPPALSSGALPCFLVACLAEEKIAGYETLVDGLIMPSYTTEQRLHAKREDGSVRAAMFPRPAGVHGASGKPKDCNRNTPPMPRR